VRRKRRDGSNANSDDDVVTEKGSEKDSYGDEDHELEED